MNKLFEMLSMLQRYLHIYVLNKNAICLCYIKLVYLKSDKF